MSHQVYESPLGTRYSSLEMSELFSEEWLKRKWRQIWLEVARAEQRCGVAIRDEQIQEMEVHLNDPIDFVMASRIEREIRHDVMAHVRTFGFICPLAAPIMHLGCTSCCITDNAELMQMREGLWLISWRLARVIDRLGSFAFEWRRLPALGFTHYQPASLVTVGKRAAGWLQNFLMDLREVEQLRDSMRLRGLQGATGTQESYLTLLGGDHQKVRLLNHYFAEAFEFPGTFTITGQTYPRKVDSQVLSRLCEIGLSVNKMCNDIRLLVHDKELDEPAESGQVFSSAMPYKINPIRLERGNSTGRLPIGFSLLAFITEGTQWLERTLDDSAARRVYIPEAFLAVDGALRVVQNVIEGLVVYPGMIGRNIRDELPFMVVEDILMAMVQAGADRQQCHERLRRHAQAAGRAVKAEGLDNDLLDRIRQDGYFLAIHTRLDMFLDPDGLTGRATEQVEEFLDEEVKPALLPYKQWLGGKVELTV